MRELKNVLESLVIFHRRRHPGRGAAAGDAPAASGRRTAAVQSRIGPPRTMDEIERRAILETLERTGGHRAEAAKMLDIGLRTLQRKLKDYRDEGHYAD